MSAKVLRRFFWQRFMQFEAECIQVLIDMGREGVHIGHADEFFLKALLRCIRRFQPVANHVDERMIWGAMNLVLEFLDGRELCKSRQFQQLIRQYIDSMRFTASLLMKLIVIGAAHDDDAQAQQALFDAACSMPKTFWFSIMYAIVPSYRQRSGYWRDRTQWGNRARPVPYEGNDFESDDYSVSLGVFLLPETDPLNYVTPEEILGMGPLLQAVAERDSPACHFAITFGLKPFCIGEHDSYGFEHGRTFQEAGRQWLALLAAVHIMPKFEFDAIDSPELAMQLLDKKNPYEIVEPFHITKEADGDGYCITLPADFPS
jgi:hypothetical protein